METEFAEGRRKFFSFNSCSLSLTTLAQPLYKYLGQEVKRGAVLLEILMFTY